MRVIRDGGSASVVSMRVWNAPRRHAATELLEDLRFAGMEGRAFGVVSGKRSEPHRLIVRNTAAVPGSSGRSPVESLDVWLLHRLVIEGALGIDASWAAGPW